MEKFKNKYRIPTARLAGWDYSRPGSYFITICTKNREHFFGEIQDHEMYLNEIGIIADKCWAKIPDHFKNTELGEFVIMPNHVHGIININDSAVETGHALSPDEIDPAVDMRHALSPDEIDPAVDMGHALSPDEIDPAVDMWHALSPDENKKSFDETGSVSSNETGHALSLPNTPHFRFRNQGKNSVSAMVGSFKSAVTKFSHPINPRFEWQTRFHDHVIRNHDDFLRISNYILNNTANWEADKFFK